MNVDCANKDISQAILRDFIFRTILERPPSKVQVRQGVVGVDLESRAELSFFGLSFGRF